MRHRRLWRATALLQVAALLSGCLSLHTKSARSGDDQSGGIAVEIFADDDARHAGRPTDGVVSQLDRREDGHWVPAFHSLAPRWTSLGLPPGTYRLSFPERLDDRGATVKLDGKPMEVAVRQGRITRVEATLSHVPKALIAAGVVVAVVAAIALAKWLDDHDLLPPPPPPGVVEAALDLSLEIATARDESPELGRPAARPFVTSHFPSQGGTVIQPRLRITFSLSQPLDGAALSPDAVVVEDEDGNEIAGRASYDASRWWVVWEPDEDFPEGSVLRATLDPETVVNRRGDHLPEPVSFTFFTR